MNGRRWNTWGQTSPLWGTGLILIAIGVFLVFYGVKQVR